MIQTAKSREFVCFRVWPYRASYLDQLRCSEGILLIGALIAMRELKYIKHRLHDQAKGRLFGKHSRQSENIVPLSIALRRNFAWRKFADVPIFSTIPAGTN
jgi:hypothetical protein